MILWFQEILFHRKAPHIFFSISNEYFHWIAKYVMFSISLISIEMCFIWIIRFLPRILDNDKFTQPWKLINLLMV